jgi:hypothetical protein
MKCALLVGVNYVNDPANKLNGCIVDVVNVSNMLVDAYDYDRANIVILRDDINVASTMPTRSNILNALKTLVSKSANCTEIWFHYSGHGSQVKDNSRDEADGLDEVIVPCDFMQKGVIVDDELLSIIKESKCTTILLTDSCHSGSIFDLGWSFENKNGTFVKTQNNKQLIQNPNIFMFSGCRDNQTSADAYSNFAVQAVGAFTTSFIDSLRANHHNVSIFKLYRDICTTLGQGGFLQFPILSSSSQNVDYTFVRASPMSSTKSVIPLPVPVKPVPLPVSKPVSKPVPVPVPVKPATTLKKNVFFNNMNYVINPNK